MDYRSQYADVPRFPIPFFKSRTRDKPSTEHLIDQQRGKSKFSMIESQEWPKLFFGPAKAF